MSEHEVATIAKRLSGSNAAILGQQTSPKHQIATDKIRALGMQFGGLALLEETLSALVEAAGKQQGG